MNDKLSRSGVIAVISIVVYGLIAAERVKHAIDTSLADTPIPYLSLGATFATLAMTYFGVKSKIKYRVLTALGIINILIITIGWTVVSSTQYSYVIDWLVAGVSLIIAIIYVFICIDES